MFWTCFRFNQNNILSGVKNLSNDVDVNVDLKSGVYRPVNTDCLHQIWQLWPNFRTCLIKIAHHIISSSIKLKFHDFFFLIFVRLSSGNINHLLSPPSGESFISHSIHIFALQHFKHCCGDKTHGEIQPILSQSFSWTNSKGPK